MRIEEVVKLIQVSDRSVPVTKDALIDALVPRIGITSYPWMPRGLPLGASRFGGPADLPAGVNWPVVDGRPLHLLAQLNFGDLPIERDHPTVKLLPERGWLCLFLDYDKDATGTAGEEPGVVVLQFDGESARLVRHELDPALDAETWTYCHAATVYPADHDLCLPDPGAVDSPLPNGASEADKLEYQELTFEIDSLARTYHEVTLLGSPSLFNPDLRHYLKDPTDWMLLLELSGECSWFCGARNISDNRVSHPTFGHANFIQYFVRKTDYHARRLDRGFLGYMR